MWRRLLIILTIGAVAGIFVIPLNPVNGKLLKLAWLASIGCAWAGLLLFSWRRKPLRITVLLIPVIVAIPFVLPAKKIDREELREEYVRRMTALEGTKYHWGGESSRGIDCSGLPRRALRDALLSYGLRHGDGGTLRMYVEQWWFDASARALGAGYRGYTVPLGLKGTIKEMDYSDLAPGDLAVTTNGAHILAFAGDGKWVQADPGIGSVATLDGKSEENGWFQTPVTTHRWAILHQE